MKQNIYISIVIAFAAISLLGCGSSNRFESNKPISSEVSCIEGDNAGGQTFKLLAWGIGSNNEEAETDALKAAIYAVMIGGVGGGRCSVSPILDATEKTNNNETIEKFFLFENQWKQYVRDVNNGRISPDKRIKMSDGNIKVGLEVIVDARRLNDDLIEKGITKNKLRW